MTVEVGQEIGELAVTATLATSVAYAGASGDLNPLHYDPDFARQVSPTGAPIAHGMYSMGLISRLVTGWAGGPERVRDIEVRFTKPWPLGTTTTFRGRVTEVGEGIATVEVEGTNENGDVVAKATAHVAIA